MSSFRKPLLAMVCLVLLVGTSSVMAQRSGLYNNWSPEEQTRNIPAGTIRDPGSQLLYLVDTGVNLRAAAQPNLSGYNASLAVVDQGAGRVNPFGVGGDLSIYNNDSTVDRAKINQSFITITNTHPTQAVTVHFRYFNDECIDVLDFLVLLTCNDTLIFDPFNFNIPGTPFNTVTRIFGPADNLFTPIRAADFASGRFLIFATAAGTSYEPQNSGLHNDNAELRFPAEFHDLGMESDHCPNLLVEEYYGRARGLRANNLHVFNSSAVAFNYLIGNWTTAEPQDELGVVAHGTEAFVRPAVDLTDDIAGLENWSLRNEGDGDGPALLGDQAAGGNDFRILTGNEDVLAANQVNLIQRNNLYLAQRTHGGDTADINSVDQNTAPDPDFDSWYGALGMTSIFGLSFDRQTVNFISVVDDYNGSKHSPAANNPNDPGGAVAGFFDRSYNLNGAETTYVLQIYNNDERLFDVREGTPINISPPPFEQSDAILKITVDCLRVWVTDRKSDGTSVDDLQISDLNKIDGGVTDFLQNTGIQDPLQDASKGWIRFVRDNSLVRSDGAVVLFGTRVRRGIVHDSFETMSFVTAGFQVITDLGRGACWWLFSAASDPLVSETGDPQCNGLCDTKNNLP